MIIKASQIRGYDVITEQNQLLDTVNDVVVDPNKKKLVAIVLGTNELTGMQVVPFEKIKNISQNQVVVSSQQDIKPFSAIIKNQNPQEDNTLTSKTVVTSKGDRLGELNDVTFDTSNGKIQKLIVQENGQMHELNVKEIQAADEVVIIKEKSKKGKSSQMTNQQSQMQQSKQQPSQTTQSQPPQGMQQKGGQRISQNSQVLTGQESSSLKKEVKRVTKEAKQSLIQLFKG